jgi:hypothetical protein
MQPRSMELQLTEKTQSDILVPDETLTRTRLRGMRDYFYCANRCLTAVQGPTLLGWKCAQGQFSYVLPLAGSVC